jgi:hypothetical protein
MTSTAMILVPLLGYGLVLAVVAGVLYVVVRRAVRDGMLDARRVDRDEAALRRSSQPQPPEAA